MTTRTRRIAILLNGSAGAIAREGRKKFQSAVEAACAGHGIEARIAFPAGSELHEAALEALEAARRGEIDAVAAGGGDGTIRTVAGVLAGSDVPLGVLPLGTLNHFAKDLGIPLAIEEAVGVIAAGNVRKVDVGTVNDAAFINNSSIGLYPSMVIERERQRRRAGVPKWLAMIWASVRVLRYFPLRRLSVRAAGGTERLRTPCVFVGNNEYTLAAPTAGRRQCLDAGALCLYVTRQQTRIALIGLAVRLLLGIAVDPRDFQALSTTEVTVESRRRRLLVAVDGEVETMRSPLTYRIRPAALPVLAPPADRPDIAT